MYKACLTIAESLDVRFYPRTERIENVKWPYTDNIGIHMKRIELTNTFMIISNWQTFHGLYIYMSAL